MKTKLEEENKALAIKPYDKEEYEKLLNYLDTIGYYFSGMLVGTMRNVQYMEWESETNRLFPYILIHYYKDDRRNILHNADHKYVIENEDSDYKPYTIISIHKFFTEYTSYKDVENARRIIYED